jgi:hypothetical protein
MRIRHAATLVGLTFALVASLTIVGPATGASAYTGICNGFAPSSPADCEGFYVPGSPGVAGSGIMVVTQNPDYEWIFHLQCQWGGDQNSGPNPPSWGRVQSSLQCNLGSPATDAWMYAI